MQVFKPAPRKGKSRRLRGTESVADPPARPSRTWSRAPATGRPTPASAGADGYYYGRGTGDDKYTVAAGRKPHPPWATEGYKPDRDIIVALETDEIGDVNALGIVRLINNHRDLIDAEFALNEGSGAAGLGTAGLIRKVCTSENAVLPAGGTNKGGHSSVPSPDNAIYHLAEGLAKLAKFSSARHLNATTRRYFERAAELETPQTAADIRAVLAAN